MWLLLLLLLYFVVFAVVVVVFVDVVTGAVVVGDGIMATLCRLRGVTQIHHRHQLRGCYTSTGSSAILLTRERRADVSASVVERE